MRRLWQQGAGPLAAFRHQPEARLAPTTLPIQPCNPAGGQLYNGARPPQAAARRLDQVHQGAPAPGKCAPRHARHQAPTPSPLLHPPSQGHPCYNASKDLVIPAFKPPHMWEGSPYMSTLSKRPLPPRRARDILAFFRGDMGGLPLLHGAAGPQPLPLPRALPLAPPPAAGSGGTPPRKPRRRAAPPAGEFRRPWYSRGLRQRLHKLARAEKWAEVHKIWIGNSRELEGQYTDLLARSVFCLVMPGEPPPAAVPAVWCAGRPVHLAARGCTRPAGEPPALRPPRRRLVAAR